MSWQQAYQNGKNGQSFFGQGYTSMWEGMAHADGQAARAAESAAKASSSSSPIFSTPAYTTAAAPSRGGGGGIGRAGLGGRQKASGGLLSSVFVIGLIVGVHDNLANKTPEADSAAKAYGFVYGCSDAIGKAVEGIGNAPVFAWAGWGIRWGIAIPVGLTAGAGAFAGNLAIGLGNAFITGWREAGTQQAATVATVSAINLNLRSGPGPDFDVVAVMPHGFRANVVGHAQNGWVELNEVRGSEGQIYHGFASPTGVTEQ